METKQEQKDQRAPSARTTTFTPGPWGLESTTRNEWGSDLVITDRDGGYTIASCRSATGIPDIDEAEANARLIAAAPQLYEALRWALQYGTFEVATDNPLHGSALDHARAALARAERGNQ